MEILRVDKITDQKWLNLYVSTFHHNGHTGQWVFASRKQDLRSSGPAFDAVVIVPLIRTENEPPRLVLIKEYRVPIGGPVYAFPAGLLEPGESLEESVRRELREETGLEVTAFKKVSPPLLSSCGLSDEAAVLVYVDVRATPELRPLPEPTEEIEVLLLDYSHVCQLCESPDAPIDAKAWATLFMYQQLGQLI